MKPRVLIVDDASEIRDLFRVLLKSSYTIDEAVDGERAIEAARRSTPDVVLLDLSMPGLDGYETCRQLRKMTTLHSTRIIVVSGRSDAKDLQMAFDAGADDFLIKPVAPTELISRVKLHSRLRSAVEIAASLQSYEALSDGQLLAALDRSQEILANTLLRLAENRDNETGEHLVRMRDYAVLLARELQHSPEYAHQIDASFISELHWSCPLHDIGKVGIPDQVLLKPGRLSPQEFEVMKEHTSIGANILEQAVRQMSGRGFLIMAVDIARYHHERWDGQGYPAGVSGSQIPLSARIVAVADVYDALTTERCYKKPWTPAHAKQTIESGAGTQFDPVVVAAFQRCFMRLVALHHSEELGKDQSESIKTAIRQHQPRLEMPAFHGESKHAVGVPEPSPCA